MGTAPGTTAAANNTPLAKKQQDFARYIAQFMVWVCSHPGYELSMAEGYVGDTDAADGDIDGPHLYRGGHYHRLAQDLNLFVNGEFITRGDHPAYVYIGEQWEAMHPLSRWGGRWGDANHFSFEHEGVK